MATHSKILAWEISWTEGTCQATVHGVAKESETTQHGRDPQGVRGAWAHAHLWAI